MTHIKESDINSRYGNELDKIGEILGVLRDKNYTDSVFTTPYDEPDSVYKNRLKQRLLEVNQKGPEYKFFQPYNNRFGCDCGAWILGFDGYGPRHSRWCSLFSEK